MAGNEVILLNRGCMGEPYVIENVCFVGSDESVDITIEQGRIADVRSSEKSVAKASKTWIIPGLWDCHTHFTQWSYTLGRLDLIDARSADEAMSLLREHLRNAANPARSTRTSTWSACGSDTPCGPMMPNRHWLRSTRCRATSPWRCQAQTCIAAG